MGRYRELKKRIQSRYDSLPKSHKKIADFFIDNFDRIPFLSIKNISGATSVSVASIVRFAQKIGFSGFLEMREEIAATLQNQINRREIFSLIDDKHLLKEDTLTSVANQDITNINETLNLIDRANFDKAIKLILNSGKVYTAGLGISFLLAQILAYQLNQVAVRADNLAHNSTSFLEQLLFLNSKDLIIAFSFPPYSKETIDAAKMAKRKKIKVVAITDKNASPITLFSDVQLVVKSENMLFTNSFSAISVLINAIATEVAIKNKSRAKKMLEDINTIAELQELIIS